MNEVTDYKGGCFCGSVQFTLSGEPEAMAYCHCDSCRHWSAGPVSAFRFREGAAGPCPQAVVGDSCRETNC